MDPAQQVDQEANLLIEDGKIAGILRESPEADQVIDATGKIVCPGFIDIHTHEDELDPETGQLRKDASMAALRMGVTTDVVGNCGENTMAPDAFLDLADREGMPVNMAILVGHGFLRTLDKSVDKYQPVSAEVLDGMIKTCQKYLDAGAMGVSFGVKYIPGTTWEEQVELAKLCRQGDKLVASHVRNDVDGVFDAARELADLGKEAGVRVQFSHIGSMGGYGQMARLLDDVEIYRANGINLLCDCYPYDAFSTTIGATTYDPEYFAAYHAPLSRVMMVSGKYAGQRLNQAIYDEVRRDDPGAHTVGFLMDQADIEMALLSPFVMVGSDGIVHQGAGHPRVAGAFPKFLKEYVRTGKLSLLDGIAKVTTMAAQRLGLKNKGNFYMGSDADVTIFDLETITDHATFENGLIPATGISRVLLGGETAVENDRIVRDNLGRSVRR